MAPDTAIAPGSMGKESPNTKLAVTSMKLSPTSKFLTLAAGIAMTMAASPAHAAGNPGNAPSDLVLTFQNPNGSFGSDQTMTVAIGNVATVFRDATPGSFTSLVNIGSQLASTFGGAWDDQSSLWMGAVNFRGTLDTGDQLLTGDPTQTIYATRSRDSLGVVGQQNSIGLSIGQGNATNTVSSINSVKTQFENIGTSFVMVLSTSTSVIDDQNPFNAPGVQGGSYGGIDGGVQDDFFSGSLGTFGAAGNVELALDLFRVQFRNDIAGQAGFGDPTQIGKFLGTITIDSTGEVGFTAAAVPEPTATLMALAGAGAMLFIRRRTRLAQL